MNLDVSGIKLLRKKTSAGMLDCRKALAEAAGDTVVAEALLKEWGLAGVENRADRSMCEGRIFLRAEYSNAAMVQIACESDFVARSEAFLAAGAHIVDIAFAKKLRAPDSEMEGMIADIASVFKENIALQRLIYMEGGANERISSYVHGDGKVGALVLAKANNAAAFGDERIKAFFHDLALHVAAFKPLFCAQDNVPADYRREKEELFRKEVREDPKMRGKGTNILEGAVIGKMRKHLAEVCLLGHGFVKDEKIPVSEVMWELAERTLFTLSISAFAYFKIGEE